MPLNGKANPVAKPSWLKDTPSTQPTTATTTPAARPSWARKTPEAKKDDSGSSERDSPAKVTVLKLAKKDSETPGKVAKKDSESPGKITKKDSESPGKVVTLLKPVKKDSDNPKTDVTVKLQSREVKVPLKIEKTAAAQSILKKSDPKVEMKQTLAPEQKTLSLRESKTPSKSPTPLKTPPSKTSSATPSKSPSKTPDYDDSDEDSSYEEETDSDDDDSDEITDSDDELFNDEPEYPKPPSPGSLRKHLIIPPLKKVTSSPDKSEPDRSQSPEHTFKKPELRKVITRQKSEVKERSASPEPKFFKPKLRKVPSSLRQKGPMPKEKLPVIDLKKTPLKPDPETSTRKMSEQFPHKPSNLLKAESSKRIPPPPPPPPPPPGLKPPSNFEKKPLTQQKRETIEKLKSRPRRRPDWSEMMKEVEESRVKKLRHVQCNDRSSPIITCKSMAKVQGQYVFETEKKNTALDKLLSEIQSGVKLKPTKTNDRSKPILNGLRKFRRQMTIEEQIQKSESKAVLTENSNDPILDDDEEDELDDIDKVRDDLQSTKQMLALELRNKEAQERENKRLLAKIANLEAEMEREKARLSGGSSEATTTSNGTDEVLINSLKKESEDAQKTSKLLEKKYQDAAERLDGAQKEIEEQKRLIANLEKKLQGGPDGESRRQSEAVQQKESSPEMELELSEEEEDESEEKKAERAARRLKREVDMLRAKLTRLKDKENTAKSDRKALRDGMKKNQQILKAENKKFKKLQKEVEKMAAMMKAVEDECEDEEAEEKEEEAEEEQSEESEPESEESESEESDSETESQSEPEDAEDNKLKENLEPRIKRHDSRLSSLKKGNYLLEANVERLKDEIKVHRDKCEALQADLDSVIDLC